VVHSDRPKHAYLSPPRSPKISKEYRTQKSNAFKLKLRASRALSAAAAEADVAGSSFAFDARSVSRFICLHSDCVSESMTREAQSGYIWNGWSAKDFFWQPRNTRESVADFGWNVCHVNILDMTKELGKL
jgi:hypothetical protein